MKLASTVLLVLFSASLASCEVFSALAELEELIHTESVLIESLEKYMQVQEQKISLLKRYIDLFKSQYDIAIKDAQAFVGNPLNAYLLVKRLSIDWTKIAEVCTTNVGIEFLTNLQSISNLKFPTHEDLNGAASALIRLQDTYNLHPEALAKGELKGVNYGSELTANDCFELGKQSFLNDDFYHAVLWFREANFKAANKQAVDEKSDRMEILEYLSFSIFKQGNIPLALNFTNQLLQLNPSHTRAHLNKLYFEQEFMKSRTSFNNLPDLLDLSFIDNQKPMNEYQDFYKLCRGDIAPPIEITSKLTCYYLDNKMPFLKIAPFKVEEAYNDPLILIFYDVMSNSEIETIKSLARPRFARAAVFNSKTGEYEAVSYRTSKSAWLKNDDHKVVNTISQRVGDMTSLDQRTAEDLQVGNYGIGGHYNAHFDFARKFELNLFSATGWGNRIATVLFYMSDVEQGGATAFPNIRATVWPKKGSAVFWYNLFPSGDGNIKTLHGACPVLVGSKWVSNKWIHEFHQEFRRPCGLEPPPSEMTI